MIYFQYIIDLVLYFSTGKGENCKKDQIIKKESACKTAASYLGFNYENITSSVDHPAGCFWHSINPVKPSDYNVYFNTITNPFLTNPGRFGPRGGICMKLGKNRSYYNIEYVLSKIQW